MGEWIPRELGHLFKFYIGYKWFNVVKLKIGSYNIVITCLQLRYIYIYIGL